MCGICGIFSLARITQEDALTVRRMMDALEHRGPDGEGTWVGERVVLGHRRLAIIDLIGGHQPIFNETDEICVVYNGEIYNFQALRQQLIAAGHHFRTACDTEVLVHGYEQWGDSFVERLRGMFAFALWDDVKKRLLLVRDRFGVKPLYYVETNDGRLLFASEIKAFFVSPRVVREVNDERLAEYLIFRSIVGQETIFRGINEVEPGTFIEIRADGYYKAHRYWTPEVGDTEPQENLVDKGRELLVDAVKIRLVSDVALGTITSGGVDSSLISVIAAELTEGPIDTFCVGFDNPAYDERPFARLVATQIGSRHHEIEVSPTDIDRELNRLTWAHDEPLTHPNAIPMHLVFRESKERAGVTVLLSGEGADEIFGGYAWYATARHRDKLLRLPGLRTVTTFAPSIGKLATLKKVLTADYLISANAFSSPSFAERWLRGKLNDFLEERRQFWPQSKSGVEGLFVYDQRTYLPPLLHRQDRMSMAAGLEAREPFLDHQLVEWTNALKADVKLAGGKRKALLKLLAERWLPKLILKRKKVGFEMPLGDWMRLGGPLAHRVEALLDRNSFVAAIGDYAVLRRLVDEHQQGVTDHSDTLWSLIALNTWAEVFLGAQIRFERLPGAKTGKVVRSDFVYKGQYREENEG